MVGSNETSPSVDPSHSREARELGGAVFLQATMLPSATASRSAIRRFSVKHVDVQLQIYASLSTTTLYYLFYVPTVLKSGFADVDFIPAHRVSRSPRRVG
jgi:hypothetical protein